VQEDAFKNLLVAADNLISIFDQCSKLYFSLDAQPDIQSLDAKDDRVDYAWSMEQSIRFKKPPILCLQ
jgi:hypothetical protein